MPLPSTITDLSETPASNSPQGSEPVGTSMNEYFQYAFAFIRQIYDGTLKPLAATNWNGQKLTGLAAGSTSPASTDAVNGSQLRAFSYKYGEIRTWAGAPANIASVWGAGWQLADGTNNSPDLRDRFIVGAGSSYSVNAIGGANSVALTVANLAAHNHGVSDPGHAHGYSDPGHSHGYTDPGHSHTLPTNLWSDNGGGSTVPFQGTIQQAHIAQNTGPSVTGIQITPSSTGIVIGASSTGITTLNNGSGTAHENRPPYYALCFLFYSGAGV
ncbi:hypothetical protein QCE62_05575 [Caballeronia sp. LZ033]|uniref:hypothetical protein n=1 Tax=Caballeronia sp. LZ033 TaxID=3038566 RepID=UPI002866E34E|nr:hypothetical protein [Caballeronia sp. LZ033]MDR5813059.1 hypothetical protein [Caballeronia sp. LZ033]